MDGGDASNMDSHRSQRGGEHDHGHSSNEHSDARQNHVDRDDEDDGGDRLDGDGQDGTENRRGGDGGGGGDKEGDAHNANIVSPFPEAGYASADAFKAAAFEFSRQHGFALATRTSAKNKQSGELESILFVCDRSILFVCDRSGQYRNVHGLTDEARQRQVGSRRAGCQYRIFGKRQPDGHWKAHSVDDGAHNHAASTNPAAHPVYRHMTDEQLERVREMQNRGCQPVEILRALRQADPATIILLEDVRNTVKRQRRDDLDGRTPTQALLERLRAANIPVQEKVDPDGTLTHLYVGAPAGPAGDLLARFYKVLLMDCTYKTNMYNMPMLEVVGVAATGASFTAAVVFMAAECERDYEWALGVLETQLGGGAPQVVLTDRDQAFMNALGAIFPEAAHLLCLWHVHQNVLAKAKAILRDSDRSTSFMRLFRDVCEADTPDNYDNALEALRTADPSDEWAAMYRYLMAEWLGDNAKKVVAAWTNAVTHFGNVATSRVEGAHFTLKALLRTRVNTLGAVTDAILEVFSRQAQQVAADLARDGLTVIPGTTSHTVLAEADDNFPKDFHTCDLFASLVRRVSRHGLKLIVDRLQMAHRPGDMPDCTGYHQRVLGVPCAHDIRAAIQQRRPLPLSSVSPQWHVKAAANVVRDPHVVQPRGRPPTRGRSTRADPRHDAPNAMRTVRCSVCQGQGHNARTCTAPRDGSATQRRRWRSAVSRDRPRRCVQATHSLLPSSLYHGVRR